MRWIDVMLTTAPALVLPFAGCPADEEPIPGTVMFSDDFESGLTGWMTNADVPSDPNRPGQLVEWSIAASSELAYQGMQAVKLRLDGRQDDGTIWLERGFDVRPGRMYRVSLDFEFWSESESFVLLAMVAAYAGAQPAQVEADFNTQQAANLLGGWRAYSYEFDVQAGEDGRAWVGLGISAVWETELTYYLDNVEIVLEPQS